MELKYLMDTFFDIQYSEASSKETTAIFQYCIMENVPYKYIKNVKDASREHVPVGSVEFCLQILGRDIQPDYYPDFLKDCLYRNVYRTTKWPLGKKLFIKPADKYKRFTGFITNGGYRKKKRPPYWCSDIVIFVNEWRYYVANGKVLTGEWYYGDEINTPDAPVLNIKIPDNYCGALDFGMLETGELALVEAQHPFACGWYGKDYKLYAKWLIEGWKYMCDQI